MNVPKSPVARTPQHGIGSAVALAQEPCRRKLRNSFRSERAPCPPVAPRKRLRRIRPRGHRRSATPFFVDGDDCRRRPSRSPRAEQHAARRGMVELANEVAIFAGGGALALSRDRLAREAGLAARVRSGLPSAVGRARHTCVCASNAAEPGQRGLFVICRCSGPMAVDLGLTPATCTLRHTCLAKPSRGF